MRALNKNLEPIAEIDLFKNANWHIEWYGYGSFEIRMPIKSFDDKMTYILNQDLDELGIITSIKKDKKDVIIKGKMLLFILNKYVINQTVNYTNQTTEYIAKDLVKRFCTLENLEVDSETRNLGKIIDTLQVTGENLGDYIIELLEEQELSAHIDYDYLTNKMRFTIKEGADNTETKPPLSESFETISDFEYNKKIEDYRNFAYVAGEEKEGQARVIVEVDARKDLNEEKYELWVDARSTRSDGLSAEQYKEALKQKGLEKLKKYEIEELIDITPPTLMPIGAEFELGEKRLFIWNEINSEQRITGVIFGYENGCVKKSIMFGNQKLLRKEK